MALLTAADMQSRGVGVGLAPADLQAIIDAEAAELTRRFGPAYAGDGSDPPRMTEAVRPRGNSLYLRRPIAAVVTVADALYVGDPAPTTRAAADYYVWAEEGRIERGGAAAGWGRVAIVTYSPTDDTALRNAVLLELVRIATEQTTGVSSGETVSAPGGYSYSTRGGSGGAQAWADARARQYARMGGGWLS